LQAEEKKLSDPAGRSPNVATGSNDTRYTKQGRQGTSRPARPAAAYNASTQSYAAQRPGYGKGAAYTYSEQKAPSAASRKKTKKSKFKRFWKRFVKNMRSAAAERRAAETQSSAAAYTANAAPYQAQPQPTAPKKPFSWKRFWRKTKKTAAAGLRYAARGIYVGVRKVYGFLMKQSPRTLLVAGSTFGFVMITIIVLAIALPGRRSSANAEEQLAAYATEQMQAQETIDSGVVDPYENYDAEAEAAALEAQAISENEQTAGDADVSAVYTTELEEGDEGAIIAEIQTRLMELGYMDSDEPTEHFGPLTRSALVAFQRHNELDDDGICGETTYTALMNEDAKIYVMQNGDSGEDVKGVQQRLYELGYMDNKANVQGTFGDKTEEAAKEFQKKNDLTVDGKVGTKTIEMLYNEDVVSNAYTLGDENQVIKDCQTALKKLGYITFKPDGVMGRATVSAIKSFQQANGLTRDGCLGPVTRDMLLSGEAQAMVIQLGDYGTAVKNIQKRLAELNYMTSANATGYFGEITQDAVKAFQKRSGLTQDGKVGAVTLTMLNSSSAKKSTTSPSTSKESPSSSSSSGSSSSSSSGSSSGGSSGVSNKTGVEKLIALAESKIGSTYVRGAKGPNTFDCSGFVYWCLKNSGVSISYMTSITWRTTSRFQRITSMSSLQRGDILVFSGSTSASGHVGIYIGGGKMIDASSSQGKVRTSSTVLKSGGYWSQHFICAYRVF